MNKNKAAKETSCSLMVVEEYHSSFNPGYYIPSGVIEILSKIDCRLEFDICTIRGSLLRLF